VVSYRDKCPVSNYLDNGFQSIDSNTLIYSMKVYYFQ
jgi:hypothetical protein